MSAEHDRRAVVEAAERRAAALAARDAAALRAVTHPHMRWTTHRGDVLGRDEYARANTEGAVVWREQRLEDTEIAVVGGTAVLTALAVDKVEVRGIARTNRLRLTQTWVRVDGDWLCLGGHAGPLVD